ncbi:uncharacterized protein [Temnothorax nylanderi]|uniref:uncharacterized protein isoform X2 n=1 Tax=Temnothorax nylanderi TaxID=102681 RepID=UPI003A84CE24
MSSASLRYTRRRGSLRAARLYRTLRSLIRVVAGLSAPRDYIVRFAPLYASSRVSPRRETISYASLPYTRRRGSLRAARLYRTLRSLIRVVAGLSAPRDYIVRFAPLYASSRVSPRRETISYASLPYTRRRGSLRAARLYRTLRSLIRVVAGLSAPRDYIVRFAPLYASSRVSPRRETISYASLPYTRRRGSLRAARLYRTLRSLIRVVAGLSAPRDYIVRFAPLYASSRVSPRRETISYASLPYTRRRGSLRAARLYRTLRSLIRVVAGLSAPRDYIVRFAPLYGPSRVSPRRETLIRFAYTVRRVSAAP